MLRNIDPVISPELLDVLFRMGHGDEIVLADAFFPGDSFGKRIIRADGIGISRLLEGIMPPQRRSRGWRGRVFSVASASSTLPSTR